MSIIHKVKKVEAVYNLIDKDINRFKKKSGLQCDVDCSKCCLKPGISASILECLPLAFRLYSKGLAKEWLEKARHFETGENSNCMLFNPAPEATKGNCSEYEYRPLLCRLFTFSAKMNKYGKPVLVTCSTIKEKYHSRYLKVIKMIETGMKVPIMKNFFFRLYSIDSTLSQTQYDINTAIRSAIEEVLLFFLYREK